MRRLTQGALMGVLVLVAASLAAAQQAPEPVVRVGNFIEVANDVFMHIMAATEMHYNTVENRDFEKHVRDRTNSRFPGDTAAQLTDSDAAWFQNRLGVEARYQKNLTMYLLFEHRQFVDGNTIDDRSNSTTPGGTDVFGRAPATENAGFHTERYWIDYKFAGTPLRMRVGADLWNVDQAGLYGDDDPRFALFGEFGDFDAMVMAVPQYSAQRLGLENDNDLNVYTFSAGYNLRPHRVQLDVVYFRDRFAGADLAFPRTTGNGIGFPGQKTDSVLIMGSVSGRLGPVRGLVEGLINVGHARGGVTGLQSATAPTGPQGFVGGRGYDIFSGAVVAYAEADLGIVRPFVAFVWGSGDGDPTDKKLHGFSPAANQDVTQITGTSWFDHLDTSANFAGRDYACPARSQGMRNGPTAATGPLAIGTQISTAGAAGFECSHTVANPFNQRLGNQSTPGIFSTYSNPGTLVIAPGVKVYPLKGHELVGSFVYRGMVKTNLLERAFVKGIDPGFSGHIGKDQIYELGGYWQWTLNPYFDIRLLGQAAWLGDGYKDLAQMADCNQQLAGFQACGGKNVALRADIRFRARF